MEMSRYDFYVDADISLAKTIHTAVYHDVAIFRLLIEKYLGPR